MIHTINVILMQIGFKNKCLGEVGDQEEEEEEEEEEVVKEVKRVDQKMEEVDKALLRAQFALFSKFGDKSADGKTIKLSQSDKWFRQVSIAMLMLTMILMMLMLMMLMRMMMIVPHEDEDQAPPRAVRHLVPALGRCQKYCLGLSRLIWGS